MKLKRLSSQLSAVNEEFQKAQKAKESGNLQEAQQIIQNLKHQNIHWSDFVWSLFIIYTSLFTSISLAYLNIKNIYRSIYFWPFWLFMFCGFVMILIFVPIAISQYKLLRKK